MVTGGGDGQKSSGEKWREERKGGERRREVERGEGLFLSLAGRRVGPEDGWASQKSIIGPFPEGN